jgi:hypothetical protein
MIVNKTPHKVHIVVKVENDDLFENFSVIIEPDSEPIRLEEKRFQCGVVEGIPVTYATYGAANLPEPQDGIYYIVSAMVLNSYPEREDLLAPGPAIRNESGQIIACDGLSGTTAMLARFQLGGCE